MQSNARRIALEYFTEVKEQMPPTYFDKVNFTSDAVEKLVWHLANQKMQNSGNENSEMIFWNQVRFFKGFTEDVLDEEAFSWNENMCDSVRTFNIFNQQFLGKLYVEKHLSDELADKTAIAAWFGLVVIYASMPMFDTEHKTAVEQYSKLLDTYFPGRVVQFGELIQDGLSASREYLRIIQKQLEMEEDATTITWDEFLTWKGL
jgi:hypothetical protein